MKHRFLLAVLLVLSTLPVCAAAVGGMFMEGRSQFSLVTGNAYAFDRNYFVIGGSVSHYVADGLGAGLSLERWTGESPAITKFSPFVQYIFSPLLAARPYVGGFHRHTRIDGLPAINSTGVRAGVLMASESNAFVSFGIVHETYQDCQAGIYGVCSETNPEVGIIFAF